MHYFKRTCRMAPSPSTALPSLWMTILFLPTTKSFEPSFEFSSKFSKMYL